MDRTAVVLMLSLLVAGCPREGPSTQATRPETTTIEEVVARVGGQGISAADVAARMRDEGLDASAALEQLVDEALLVEHASRLGLRPDAEAGRAEERVMVRAMLRDFERERTPESISDEELRADFEQHRDVYEVPERRASWHILVKDPGPEGRERAAAIHAELRRADDLREVYERYAAGSESDSEVEIIAEELPLVPKAVALEKTYKDALFSAESKGLVKEVVETSYGWHAIVVTEIAPRERRRLEDVEDEIRTRLSLQKRSDKLAETIQALEREGLVELDEARAARVLSKSGRLTRADATD